MLALALLGANLSAQEGKTTTPAASSTGGTSKPQALAPGNVAHANEFGLKVLRVSPRVAVVYGDPWNNAVLALATRKGLVVVDSSWSESIAKGFREAIQSEFKRSDFACLINTHEHHDHIGGNGAFADVPIIGHQSIHREMLKLAADPKTKAKWREFSAEKEITKMHDYYLQYYPPLLQSPYYAGCVKCWQAMEKDFHGGHALVPPTVTFDRNLTLHLDDITVKLVYFGGFHSVGDTILSVPEENLVMIGQLFLPDSNAVPSAEKQLAESTTPQMVDNWFAVLREVLDGADENTRFMACSQRQFMKKEHCQRFYTYLDRLWAGVRRAKAEGKTLAQAKAGMPLQGFPEVAHLRNENWRGTEWEVLDIHQQNTEYFWRVAAK
jgi:glyoxylase-like metal-dependent hydrolase (beta-lactamase superfamily II)